MKARIALALPLSLLLSLLPASLSRAQDPLAGEALWTPIVTLAPTPTPAPTIAPELFQIATRIEPMALGEVFVNMPNDQAKALAGALIDSYDLIARESRQGHFGYMLGSLKQGQQPPAIELLEPIDADDDDERYALTAPDGSQTELEEIGRILHNTDQSLIFIAPKFPQGTLARAFALTQTAEGLAALLDMAQRNVSPVEPRIAPFARVSVYAGGNPVTEYFALSEQDMERLKFGKSMQLGTKGRDGGYSYAADYGIAFTEGRISTAIEDAGGFAYDLSVPTPLLEMAQLRCGYVLGAKPPKTEPDSATLRMFGADGSVALEQTIMGGKRLKELVTMLRGAKIGKPGDCPYDAELTIDYPDGTARVFYKASDDCGTLIAGSHTPMTISAKANRAFWKLFPVVRDGRLILPAEAPPAETGGQAPYEDADAPE